MAQPNIAVIYYSSTGHIYRLAQIMADEASRSGSEVRLRKARETAPDSAIQSNEAWQKHLESTRDVPEAAGADLEWADAYIFGSPTRFGNMAGQMKAFIDTLGGLWFQGKLANKPVTSFTSAQNPHGGQEATILSMNNVFYHWGAILVPPGYTDPSIFGAGGNPYGTSLTAEGKGQVPEPIEKAARHQCRRLVEIARKLKGAG